MIGGRGIDGRGNGSRVGLAEGTGVALGRGGPLGEGGGDAVGLGLEQESSVTRFQVNRPYEWPPFLASSIQRWV